MTPNQSNDAVHAILNLKLDLMEQLTKEFLHVDDSIAGVHRRLDLLNGRTWKNADDIMALKTAKADLASSGLMGHITASGWKTIGGLIVLLAGSMSALVNALVKLVDWVLAHPQPPVH